MELLLGLIFLFACASGSDRNSLYRLPGPIYAQKYSCPSRAEIDENSLNLGHNWEEITPVETISVNSAFVNSMKSFFDLRTFDSEGVIFYGDADNGTNWFLLALRNGKPEMQLNNQFTRITVTGGLEINDGMWHKLVVTSVKNMVILEVDNETLLTIRLVTSSPLSSFIGELRIAVGGLLINTTQLLTPFTIPLDGCMKNWNWLNQHTQNTESSKQSDPNQKCFDQIKRGAFFPGIGLTVFNADDFTSEKDLSKEGWALSVEMVIRPHVQNYLLFAVTTLDHKPLMTLISLEEKQSLILAIGNTVVESPYPENLCKGSKVTVTVSPTEIHFQSVKQPIKEKDYEVLKDSWLAKNALFFLGGIPSLEDVFTNLGLMFFHGCMQDIQVQGKRLDLDTALFKHNSISAHTCPEENIFLRERES
ncbi:sex hormone-binding globulin [Latimeria chalumnae]|uniref:Sex hormone-binding globulin n=1 Tax=Latimeria chalumnae TaxID=7897 RepID=M3XHX0_LATCH|nr:PREDICTED: sex hormone-binding globulin [Latimeria chalumnae]|eukprot:XP_005997965.2 PREDICTED: sex hormone-binding globulin [Latimeria chalumnae]